MPEIRIATTDKEIQDCFPAMHELRPHLRSETFLAAVRRQQSQGYQLIYLSVGGKIVSAAGFRILEFLAWGEVLYLDDLIVPEQERKHGYGRLMMDWLGDYAKRKGVREFHLDSGVHRFDAHRLYMKDKMSITCHHFSRKVE